MSNDYKLVNFKAIDSTEEKFDVCDASFPKPMVHEIYRICLEGSNQTIQKDIAVSIYDTRRLSADDCNYLLKKVDYYVEYSDITIYLSFKPKTIITSSDEGNVFEVKLAVLIDAFAGNFPFAKLLADKLSQADMIYNAFQFEKEVDKFFLPTTPLGIQEEILPLLNINHPKTHEKLSVLEAAELFCIQSIRTEDFFYFKLKDGSEMYVYEDTYYEKIDLLNELSTKYDLQIEDDISISNLKELSVVNNKQNSLDKEETRELDLNVVRDFVLEAVKDKKTFSIDKLHRDANKALPHEISWDIIKDAIDSAYYVDQFEKRVKGKIQIWFRKRYPAPKSLNTVSIFDLINGTE